MRQRRFPMRAFLVLQLIFVAGFAVSAAVTFARTVGQPPTVSDVTEIVTLTRDQPLSVAPLYDDPQVVSDSELAAVLKQVRPRFSPKELKPNFLEHALRTWGIDATFRDPEVLSGIEMRDVLIDHGRFLESWANETEPLLVEKPRGIGIRSNHLPGGSLHHDHWLASLTEAGIPLNEPVYGPARRNMTVADVLQEALHDFRLDQRETEWSAMVFGLWLPPTKTWRTSDGRTMSFDRLGRRLLRGHKRIGVCSGTHRVYTLMLLLRLDDDFEILSPSVRGEIAAHLETVRDLISRSQFEDGRWPSNWSAGADAVANPVNEPAYKQVIATGHHLEWLAIAPQRFHPPRSQILKAADWVIQHTLAQSPDEIVRKYTFYSHVGSALALWRGTRPAEFWRQWSEPIERTPAGKAGEATLPNATPREPAATTP